MQVKVVRDRRHALYFSRSPMPFARDTAGQVDALWLAKCCYRHLRLYAYKADFLSAFSSLEPGFLVGSKSRAAPRDGTRLSHSRRYHRPSDDRYRHTRGHC